MIKAIIFDMGGVIIDLNIERCSNTFKERAGMYKIDEFLDPCHPRGIFFDMESGNTSVEEFYGQALGYSRPGTTREDILQSFGSLFDGIDADKPALLNELKEKYPLYILSNNNPVALATSGPLMASCGIPLETTFVDCFWSFQFKMMKPDVRFFKAVAERIGLAPEELLFIDDSPRNAAAAAEAGWKSIYYIPHTDLRKAIFDVLDNQ